MSPIAGQPILSGAATRQAEALTGETTGELMARAGTAIAHAVRRLAVGAPVLVLCGPGNNGGDGYVAARFLREAGLDVRVAAAAPPATDAARAAMEAWGDEVVALAQADAAPILVDALFGTGLSRPLPDAWSERLTSLAGAARLAIAVDLPSGVDADTGHVLSPVPRFDLTLALGTVKPAHVLEPAASACGAVRWVDLDLPLVSAVEVIDPPRLPAPGAESHKYTRGMVAIIGGAMPGAAALAAEAALRAGAGYALLLAGEAGDAPRAVVRRGWTADALDDDRIGAVLVGPGLGRDAGAAGKLDAALASDHPLVIDGDALYLLGQDDRLARLRERSGITVLTPHAGEFARLFGASDYGKIEVTLAAAQRANAVIVHKGADTVIAEPDGQVRVAHDGSHWLSTAGTGDVLAGAITAMVASGAEAFFAASAGVWLHAEAAQRCGASFIADDLAHALSAARASCR